MGGNKDLKHRQELLNSGIRTQAELREIVTAGLEGKDTRAFRAQPSTMMGKDIGRDLYEIPLIDQNSQPYKLVVIVNPGLSKEGRLYGGTCFVPPDQKYFDKQLDAEVALLQKTMTRTVTREESLTVGGRPALREQDSHRQIIEWQPEPKQGQENQQRQTQPAEHKPEQKRESTAERLARQVRESEIKITFEQSRKLKP